MREWYESLELREKWLVGAGAVFLGLMLYFLMIWEPLSQQSTRLEQEVQSSRELARFMQQAEQEVRQYGGQRRQAGGSSNRSLLAVVDTTGKQSGLGEAIKRIQPEGDTTVRLWLEGAAFEELVRWLNTLKQQHGVKLASGNIDRDERTGSVKARLSLERGS